MQQKQADEHEVDAFSQAFSFADGSRTFNDRMSENTVSP
jgi:hypothetical protein